MSPTSGSRSRAIWTRRGGCSSRPAIDEIDKNRKLERTTSIRRHGTMTTGARQNVAFVAPGSRTVT